jgi:nucleoside phosphorylase
MADFTSIVAAAKPARRSERFYILAALYHLGAANTSVTVTEINGLLRLHLGRKAPAGVSGRLRQFSPDIRIAEEGPPLRWMLTEKGVQRLRALSGLELPVESTEDRYGVDVGIICALEDPEFAAVVAALGGASRWHEIGDGRHTHVYRETDLTTDSGKILKIVGTTSTSMGLTAASIVTTQLVYQFKPRIVVMTGIAAGTHDGNKQFGDVLVADPSVDYNSGKVVLENGIRGFQPDPYPVSLNPRLRSVLAKYRGPHSIFTAIREGWRGTIPNGPNRLHVGPLGGADQVIDDPTRIQEIQRSWRKLIGVEMETYGVYRSCSEAPEPKPRFLSCKAVCDFAAAKTDSWQAYAAYTAAEFAVRFLKAEWDALWPAQ